MLIIFKKKTIVEEIGKTPKHFLTKEWRGNQWCGQSTMTATAWLDGDVNGNGNDVALIVTGRGLAWRKA